MSETAKTVEQLDNIQKSAYMEFENIQHLVAELIEVRKRYAQDHLKRLPDDDRYFLSIGGINACNENLMMLLGINRQSIK